MGREGVGDGMLGTLGFGCVCGWTCHSRIEGMLEMNSVWEEDHIVNLF